MFKTKGGRGGQRPFEHVKRTADLVPGGTPNFALWCNVTVVCVGAYCWKCWLLEKKTRSPVRKLESAEVVKFSPHRQQWNCWRSSPVNQQVCSSVVQYTWEHTSYLSRAPRAVPVEKNSVMWRNLSTWQIVRWRNSPHDRLTSGKNSPHVINVKKIWNVEK